MKTLIAFALVLASSNVLAAQLATVNGSTFKMDRGGYSELLIKGEWSKVPANCMKHIGRKQMEASVTASAQVAANIPKKCDNAVITLDLEKSSFCVDQGGFEMYYPPTVVSVQCL